MRRFLLLELILVALLSVAAAEGFHRVFVGQGFLGVLAAAAVLPVLVSVIAGARKMSLSGALIASAVVFVLFAVFVPLGELTTNPLPSRITMEELGQGLVNGWAELRTVSLPTEADPRLLVTAAAVVWLGATFGAELAGRSRNPVAPVIGPLGAYAASLLFAAGQPRSSLLLPLVITAATLLIVLLHANRWAAIEPAGRRQARAAAEDRPQAATTVSPNRRVLIGLPVIVVGLLAAAALGAVMDHEPDQDAFEPRPLRSATVDDRRVLNPLASLRQELTKPPELAFSVETDRLSDALSVPRVRLATFDQFDGATWTSDAEFSKSGTVLAEPPATDAARREVQQTYRLGDLDGPWLPVADYPVGIDVGDQPFNVEFDDGSGTLITDRDQLDGLTYQLSSAVPEYSETQLRSATSTGDAFEDAEELPGQVPDAISELATAITAGASTPYEQLTALERGLAEGYGYSEEIEPGHSYGHLVRFLTQTRQGYAEQFAGSFAVMARSLGFPTRLAVGYLTVETNAETGQLEALDEVTTRQSHVWPEVYLEPLGWVPFEPTPADRTPSAAPPPPAQQPPVPAGGLVEEQAPPAGSTEEFSPEPLDSPERLNSGLVALLALMALAAGGVAGLLGAKALMRRRRRRNVRTPSQEVLGTWAEVTDRLLEVGVALDRSMTAREVVDRCVERVPDLARARLDAMVPHVTYAVFAPVEPGPERVAEMRSQADEFGRAVLAGRRLPQRALAALSPRPLLYSVRR
ncbi:MAG: hypothetical protein GEV08_07505 [Acidimicrobiia bacterium]|nr:hypothetical protein [Acidimicrobiia bacterium]